MTSPTENPSTEENLNQDEGNELYKSLSPKVYKSYPMRWFILTLFVLYSSSNAFQWTQLVIITSILEKYYNVKTSFEFHLLNSRDSKTFLIEIDYFDSRSPPFQFHGLQCSTWLPTYLSFFLHHGFSRGR